MLLEIVVQRLFAGHPSKVSATFSESSKLITGNSRNRLVTTRGRLSAQISRSCVQIANQGIVMISNVDTWNWSGLDPFPLFSYFVY